MEFACLYIYFSEEISLDISCELSAKQMIPMKCQLIVFEKIEEKILKCAAVVTGV